MDNLESDGILSRIFATPASGKILDFFLNFKEFDYSLAEISEKTGLSFRTAAREIPRLESLQMLIKHRRVAKANMYRLNTELDEIEFLEKFVLAMSRYPAIDTTNNDMTREETLDVCLNQESESKGLNSETSLM